MRTLLYVLRALSPGVPDRPRICSGCGRTTRRLTRAQATAVESRRLPACARRSCSGRLFAEPWRVLAARHAAAEHDPRGGDR